MDKRHSKIIVKRIRELCDKRGLSINALANMSGVDQATLDNIVNERTFNPRIQTLHKLALAFSMTVSEFLDYPELNEFSFEDDGDE